MACSTERNTTRSWITCGIYDFEQLQIEVTAYGLFFS